MRKIFSTLCKISNLFTEGLDAGASIAALAIRLYLAKIFLWSGWLKVTAWSSTLFLFQNEFTIVGMSPVTAAYLGTAAELILPIFFILGFGARLPALAFFIFNVFNVLFYPELLKPEFACALKDHIIWGILIAVIVFYGYGKISLDYLLQKKVCSDYKY
jgi:putative oxidoreductase